MKLFFLTVLFFISSFDLSYGQAIDKQELDSIQLYLNKSSNKIEFTLNERYEYSRKAKLLSLKAGLDSLVLKSDINLATIYLDNKKGVLFLELSYKNLVLAENLKDSIALADINKNLGYYYYNKSVDSAYFYNNKAEKLYRGLDDKFNTAVVLLEIALIQKNEKDFTASELTSIDAISILNGLESSDEINKTKAFLYNNLGLVLRQLGQFDEAIDYHFRALEIKRGLAGDNRSSIDNSKNNLANVYKDYSKFPEALEYYNEILNNKNLLKERPSFYALVLDNLGNTMYLSNQHSRLPHLYIRALKVNDSIDKDGYNSIIINQHLAQYYHNYNQSDSAKYYAYKAKSIAQNYYNDDLLKSLMLLSQVENDSMGLIHAKAYIQLNDSLQKSERTIRNKFARIRFETSQIEQENIEIARERLWLLIISIVVIFASFLLYIVINQRNKNRELQFIQKQQETNEEIYNLMLSQNETIEEARTSEKKRISQELHDGVLGRLFGTRLSLDSLNMNNSKEAIKTRSQYIDGLKTIEEDIRKVSHELNTDFISGSGFIDIIKTLIETQSSAYNLKYDLKHDDLIHWDEVTNKKKIHIYRMIQEVLHNIYKHANASQVIVSFKLKKNIICLLLTDNGLGFDVDKAKSGIGLKNLNARINELNGTIEITSEKDMGTTVTIKVPII